MDKITQFKKALSVVLGRYSGQFQNLKGELTPYIVKDEERGHYQFLWFGWKEKHHIFNIAFHAHIQNDKIYMLQDRTEAGIADWLVEEGIDKQDIVLAYFSPSHRRFLDFAEA